MRAIYVTGQYISRRWRELLVKTWKAQVTPRFSMTEGFGGALFCHRCDCYHFDHFIIAEVLDPFTLTPTGNGVGILHLTSLYPFVQLMPFIRYRTNDLVEVIRNDCSASFGLSLRFRGRWDHAAVLSLDGTRRVVTPGDIHDVLETVPGLQSADELDGAISSDLSIPCFRIRFAQESRQLEIDVELREHLRFHRYQPKRLFCQNRLTPVPSVSSLRESDAPMPLPATAVQKLAHLDGRIASAFADGATSENVKALIVEGEAASLASGEAAEQARGRALDPALTANAVAEARREMEDAAFRRERLQTAVTRLQDRLKEVRAQEEDQRRWIAYEKAKAERDMLADELKAIYPVFEAKLRNLLPTIDANDKEIERINDRARPMGADRILVAELVARGLAGFVENSVDATRITRHLRLPAFQFDRHDPYAWPRER